MVEVSEILCDCQDQNKLDPLRGLEMSAAGHFDPTARSQVLLPKDEYADQRSNRGDVHPMHLVQKSLIVEQAHNEHGRDTSHHPINLLDVSTGELRVHGSAADLHHAYPTNKKDEDEQKPIEIAE